MRDINYELRSSYFSLLAGNILINNAAIPLYYGQVPITNPPLNPSYYILINTVFSTGFNDDRFNYTQTAIQLMIVTKQLQNNSGSVADNIAGQIFGLMLTGPLSQQVQIVSGQVVDTRLQNDVIQSGLNDGQKKVLNRILTFTHKIQHYPAATGGGNIYYGVQDTDSDPVDFSRALQQNPALPISVNYGPYTTPKFYWLAVPDSAAQKTDWEDLNDTGNAGKISGDTDLFRVGAITITGDGYTLYMTRYVTNFDGYSSIVRFYNL